MLRGARPVSGGRSRDRLRSVSHGDAFPVRVMRHRFAGHTRGAGGKHGCGTVAIKPGRAMKLQGLLTERDRGRFRCRLRVDSVDVQAGHEDNGPPDEACPRYPRYRGATQPTAGTAETGAASARESALHQLGELRLRHRPVERHIPWVIQLQPSGALTRTQVFVRTA